MQCEQGFPYVSYPDGQVFCWQKRTKDSLSSQPDMSAELHATAPWLNLIEGVHWMTFVFGVAVLYVVFTNAASIAQQMGLTGGVAAALNCNSLSQQHSVGNVFCLFIAHITQIYGSYFGIVMHEYEGWQIAEFRNPLVATDGYTPKAYNNAWLRAVVYRLLFAVQATGLLCFSIGAFAPYTALLPPYLQRVQCLLTLAAAASLFVAFVGPRVPPKKKMVNNQPVLPLPVALEWAFVGNAIVNMFANFVVFHAVGAQVQASVAAWLGGSTLKLTMAFLVVFAAALGAGWWFPKTGKGVVALTTLVCVVAVNAFAVSPLTCLAFTIALIVINVPAWLVLGGGLLEGLVAESGFDQFWHFATFICMHGSQAAYAILYLMLVGDNHLSAWCGAFAAYFVLYLSAILLTLAKDAVARFKQAQGANDADASVAPN